MTLVFQHLRQTANIGEFSSHRMPPAYAAPENWLDTLDTGIAQPEICRSSTLKFKAKVDALLAGMSR